MALLVDGLIILIYFAAILSIGLYIGRRERSLHDFALGGRRVPWWAVMCSIIAAETSAATFLGAPGEGYKHRSLAYAQLVIGLILGRILVAYIFLRPYYTFRVYTVYDYLAVRFGNKSKNYCSALFLVMRTLAAGSRMFVPAVVMVLAWEVLHAGAGGADHGTVHGLTEYAVAISILTVLTCVYTAVGGIKAVIWTDVVQAALMFGSALVAIGSILYFIGGNTLNPLNGLSALTRSVPELNNHTGYFFLGWEDRFAQGWMKDHHLSHMSARDYFRLIFSSEYTLFSGIIASMMTGMAAFGTDQDMVQRLLTAETYKKSRRSLIGAAVMDLPIFAAFSFIGVLLVAYYQNFPKYKPQDNPDVFAAYILNVMPMGMRGVVLAGVFATAMGSLSAALNALATSATNDWYIPYSSAKSNANDDNNGAHHVTVARVFTAIFAALMILIAVGSAYAKVTNPDFRIIPFVLGIAGLFLGPMLGVFLLGMLTRQRGSDKGNMLAITTSLIAMVFISGQHITLLNMIHPVPRGQAPFYRLPDWMPTVSWTWYAMFGALITLGIGLCFATPASVVDAASQKAREQAQSEEATPMALRG